MELDCVHTIMQYTGVIQIIDNFYSTLHLRYKKGETKFQYKHKYVHTFIKKSVRVQEKIVLGNVSNFENCALNFKYQFQAK